MKRYRGIKVSWEVIQMINSNFPDSKPMRGLIMAGGNGTRLYPLTRGINKHMLPVFDKPMIYYPLSTLMLAGIREIGIVVRRSDHASFFELLGDGSDFGISIQFFFQDEATGIPSGLTISQTFLQDSSVCLILGDNLLIGQGLGRTLSRFTNIKGAQVFAFPVKNPSEYGVVELSKETGLPETIVEKPEQPKSNLAIPGIYFFDSSVLERTEKLRPSRRNEYEITDLLKSYLIDGELKIDILERGTGWMDAGTVDSLYGASEMIRVLQERQGLRIGVPEEVALRNGWISSQNLRLKMTSLPVTDYSTYLLRIAEDFE